MSAATETAGPVAASPTADITREPVGKPPVTQSPTTDGKRPAIDRKRYLEPSAADAGHLVGRDPRTLSRDDLKALGSQTSPIKAIRAFCIDCAGGSPAEVRKCLAVPCPLWSFRMGTNVHHAKAGSAEKPGLNPDFSEESAE